MNSRQKGVRGELLWRDVLRSQGYEAIRGRQYSGGADSPDVICNLPFHFEVKFVEKLNIRDAMTQAKDDSPNDKTPVVAHKKKRDDWLVTMSAEDFFKILRGELPHRKEKEKT